MPLRKKKRPQLFACHVKLEQDSLVCKPSTELHRGMEFASTLIVYLLSCQNREEQMPVFKPSCPRHLVEAVWAHLVNNTENPLALGNFKLHCVKLHQGRDLCFCSPTHCKCLAFHRHSLTASLKGQNDSPFANPYYRLGNTWETHWYS